MKRPGIDRVLEYISNVKSPVVIDVGGYVSAKVTRLCIEANPHTTSYILEPDPVNFAILKKTYSGQGKVHCYPVAVADKDGAMPFYVADRTDMDGTSESNTLFKRALKDKVRKGKVRSTKEIQVVTVTLQGFIEKCVSEDWVSLVKLNCEGGEYKVFDGPLDFLTKVGMLFISFHAHTKPFNKPAYKAKRAEIEHRLFWAGFDKTRELPPGKKHIWQVWERD
jgi:FkbM family methyltransferase